MTADSLRMTDREIKKLKDEIGAYNVQNQYQRDPAKNSLGKDEFLKLLTVQMSHQDPLSPMDNKDMIAQLAQFSSVEQMTQVNQNLDSMKKYFTSQSGYSMLGKSVEIMDEAGNRFLGPVEMVMENDKGVALAVRTQNGLLTVSPDEVMIVHSNGDLMASESLETANQILQSQSSDEASQLFNNSLASKAVVTRPSDSDNGNSGESFTDNILRSAITEDNIETVKSTVDTTSNNLELEEVSIEFRNDIKDMLKDIDLESETQKSLGELKAEEALIEKKLNEMF